MNYDYVAKQGQAAEAIYIDSSILSPRTTPPRSFQQQIFCFDQSDKKEGACATATATVFYDERGNSK